MNKFFLQQNKKSYEIHSNWKLIVQNNFPLLSFSRVASLCTYRDGSVTHCLFRTTCFERPPKPYHCSTTLPLKTGSTYAINLSCKSCTFFYKEFKITITKNFVIFFTYYPPSLVAFVKPALNIFFLFQIEKCSKNTLLSEIAPFFLHI